MSTGDEFWALSDDGWEPDEDDEDWDDDGDTFGSAAAETVPELFEAGFLPREPGLDPPDLVSGPAGGFAGGGVMDAAPPCSTLAGFAEEVTGLSGRCAGASDDELVGVLRAWGRLESWAAERKLAVIAELIRRRPAPGNPPSGPGGMPRGWGKFCGDELAATVAISAQAAEKTLQLAHDLAARLSGTARALREGLIDLGKARIIAEVTRALDPEEAAAAEALILAKVAGKTPGQVRVIAARAATSVNPAAAQARRERAQRDARVELWREDAGTAALCGRDLPPADALAADQRITAYARELKAAGLDGTMDQLRARAFLDLALGICSRPMSPSRHDIRSANHAADADHNAPTAQPAQEHPAESSPAQEHPAESSPAQEHPAEGSSFGHQRPTDRPAAAGPAPGDDSGADGSLAAAINLTIPLATLLGLAERPREAAGLGAIDPALARELARRTVGNPRTTWCVTVTDHDGHATGHGCARPPRRTGLRARPEPNRPGPRSTPGPNAPGPGSTPGPDGSGPLTFTRGQGHGPAGGYGRWRLRIGGDRQLLVDLEPLAVTDCDHRHESAGYQPSDTLRHLVQIRDAECTWPPCRRAARRCDFDHAIPWDQGGRTCSCNGGPRCRHHHHAKQAHGWKLEQKQPGYHTWTTPAGRTYTTGPTEYPI